MVEAIDLQEESKIAPVSKRTRKHFWAGCKLPSMGCLVTVFQFFGYKDEIESIVK